MIFLNEESKQAVADFAKALGLDDDNWTPPRDAMELEGDLYKLIDYARELAEEWVPDEWRGKDGWRIRRVQEKHGVRHLFDGDEE